MTLEDIQQKLTVASAKLEAIGGVTYQAGAIAAGGALMIEPLINGQLPTPLQLAVGGVLIAASSPIAEFLNSIYKKPMMVGALVGAMCMYDVRDVSEQKQADTIVEAAYKSAHALGENLGVVQNNGGNVKAATRL